MEIYQEIKKLVDKMCETLDLLAENVGLPEGTGNAARMELGLFMMYLSASDGHIEWDEAKAISEICNLNLTPSNIGDYIREHNIYSTEFEQKVPVTFDIIVKADNALRENGCDISGSESMLATYKAVGEVLIKSDGDIDENEVADYKIYINMLEKYRDKNCAGVEESTTGFVKNGVSVAAPSKGSVIAPKKG